MTKHYNPSIVSRAARLLNSKSGDFLPDEVQGPVATIEITPRLNVFASGSGTVYTTPADKDFYLTNVMLSTTKSATDTGTFATLVCTVDGKTQTLIQIFTTTLIQDQQTVATQYKGLRVDPGTNIVSSAPNFTANRATIAGYTEDVKST